MKQDAIEQNERKRKISVAKRDRTTLTSDSFVAYLDKHLADELGRLVVELIEFELDGEIDYVTFGLSRDKTKVLVTIGVGRGKVYADATEVQHLATAIQDALGLGY